MGLLDSYPLSRDDLKEMRRGSLGGALPAGEEKDRQEGKSLRVAFVHPDLGLGGAERLVVDAAVELACNHNCEVEVFTAHHDEDRCFEETRQKTGRPLFKVTTKGEWFPRTLGGRFVALCAMVRCLIVAAHVASLSLVGKRYEGFRGAGSRGFDVVILDQVSVAVLPFVLTNFLIRLSYPRDAKRRGIRVVFYCHYPDLLLCQRSKRDERFAFVLWLKRLYRYPLDWLEEWTTGMAHAVLVNSNFTKEVFFATFRGLARRNLKVRVLYPAVATLAEDIPLGDSEMNPKDDLNPKAVAGGDLTAKTFLSINRFERKKDIGLAILALKETHEHLRSKAREPDPKGGQDDQEGIAGPKLPLPKLVIAGGYDARLPENVAYMGELRDLCRDLGLLPDYVSFFPSFTEDERTRLLEECACVVYTPQREHFGIVPLEAMAAGRPVVACNSGGPLETVLDGKTGFICEPTPGAFAAAMASICDMDEARAARMRRDAVDHIRRKFSRESFGRTLHTICTR